MDFKLNAEQELLRSSVERFVREHYGMEARRQLLGSAEGFSRVHWALFADLGWLGIALPPDVGGLGCSFAETALVMEQFGHGLVLEPFLGTSILCARIIDRSASESHRARLLPQVIGGNMLLALAHEESGMRFDLGAPPCAKAVKQHNGYVLNGNKTLVLGAETADKLIVSARTSDAGPEFALFLVDRMAQGVTCEGYRLIDGTRAADMDLDGVAVSTDDVLVGPANARSIIEEAIDRATLAAVAEAVGAMQSVIDITNEYLKTRVQFGQPIGKFQALQHRMADMFVEIEQSRSILCRGIAHLDAEPASRKSAVSAAKALAGTAGKFIGAQGIQLHGGIGMTEECQVGHFYKKLVWFEKIFGDTEYHIGRLAQQVC